MKRFEYIIWVLLLASALFGCSKDEQFNYTDQNAPAPSQVSNIKIEETPGGAILTYEIPVSSNLSYIKAVYEIQPGVYREAISSVYSDTLSLVGFGDTLTHEVKLFSVGKNEKASEPVIISVTPKTPPVSSVFQTLDLTATFGGVRVSFKNDLQANLAIFVMVDSTGLSTWAPVTTFYTKAKEGKFSARGYEPEEKKFAVFIKDRWNNRSDTLIKNITPKYEELIPKIDFRAVYLPTDTYQFVESFSIEKLWDGSLAQNTSIFATLHTSPMPQWFTIDLGHKISLSRFKEFQRSGYEYSGAAVKSFEIWGSNNPDLDGGWNNWTLLGKFDSFKPSGLPLNSVAPEDRTYASFNGEDFEFDAVPPVRYIRFKTLETYGNILQIVIAELTFWGQIEQ